MATDRNAKSVLAKLMGIERPSLTMKNQGRCRVLSENYIQNIALVTKENQKVKSPQDQRFELCESFNRQGNGNSNSRLSKSSHLGSSHSSSIKKQESDKRCISPAKSLENMEIGCFTRYGPKVCYALDNGCCLPCKPVREPNSKNGKADFPAKLVSLPSSPTSSSKQNISSCVRNKGKSFQGRKRKSLYNDTESIMKNLASTQEIAKQVNSQIKQSVWHSFADVSEYRPGSDKRAANEHGEMTSSSSCLSTLESEHANPSSGPITRHVCQETLKIKKELPESWRVKKSPGKARISSENHKGFHHESPFVADELSGGWAGAARYLAKPIIFPSAWVPRRRMRDLNLDPNWCIRAEKNCLKFDNSVEEELGHEFIRLASESISPRMSSEEYDVKKGTSIDWNDLESHKESSLLEEISSALDSFSESSVISDIECPMYHEALVSLNDTSDKHTENHVFQTESLGSALSCNVVRRSVDNGEVIDEGNDKMAIGIKLKRKHSSTEAIAHISPEDKGSSFSEFVLKQQEKENPVEPNSPMSSLEGPEACGCQKNSIVESYQICSGFDCCDNSFDGMQNASSLDSGSEGPEMVISSDGDSNEGDSIGCYREYVQIMELYGTLENRDFSYVVDIISEMGFPTLNSGTETEAWRSQGYALNPLVFGLLEKKYEKQAHWEKSERKLLFDRVNLGLMEMAWSLDPTNLRHKPLSKRFGSPRNQELIEEELWALLVKQEEELTRKSSKVCGTDIDWFRFEAYTYLIVKELESLVLDELVEELVSMAVFF